MWINAMTGSMEHNVNRLLHQLNSGDAGAAWAAFIDAYAGLMMRTVIQFEYEQARSNECFLYVCEKLYEGQFRRLLTFSTAGRSSFSSWLTTVVFNLGIDWHGQKNLAGPGCSQPLPPCRVAGSEPNSGSAHARNWALTPWRLRRA